MKKIVLIVLSVCLAGLFAGCDKDEGWNPFVGTTWKHRNEEVKYGQIVYTYNVIRFYSHEKYIKWKEDESGSKISSQSKYSYVIDRSQSLLILDPNGLNNQCKFYETERPISSFWYKYSDSDERIYYYRQ